MLWEEAGIWPLDTDVRKPKGPRSHNRQAQSSPQYLTAAFAVRAIERENIHVVVSFSILSRIRCSQDCRFSSVMRARVSHRR
jgi:hypothetical protein